MYYRESNNEFSNIGYNAKQNLILTNEFLQNDIYTSLLIFF